MGHFAFRRGRTLNPRNLFVGLAIVALVAISTAPAATATNYVVSANPYTARATLLNSETWDTHELVAQNGQNVAYTMTVNTTGACLSLLFVKGHNASLSSQYYVSYSEENCVQTYSKSFPVGSSDGTQFTVLLATSYNGDVDYTVSISVTSPAIPSWLVGLLVVIAIIAVLAIVGALIRRRRKPAMMPPMAPPPYVGPGAQMPPQQYPPQQYPPQQPPYGPPPPPP